MCKCSLNESKPLGTGLQEPVQGGYFGLWSVPPGRSADDRLRPKSRMAARSCFRRNPPNQIAKPKNPANAQAVVICNNSECGTKRLNAPTVIPAEQKSLNSREISKGYGATRRA